MTSTTPTTQPLSRGSALLLALGMAAGAVAVLQLLGVLLHHPEPATAAECAGQFVALVAAFLVLRASGSWQLLRRAGGLPRTVVVLGWPALAMAGLVALLGQLAAGGAGKTVAVSVVWFLLGVALTALFEEVLCRGAVLETLLRGGLAARASVLVSAVIFALMHLANLLGGGATPVATGMQVAYTFCLGVLLGAIRLVTGSLWPAVVVHAIFNFLGDLSLLTRGRPVDTGAAADMPVAVAGLFLVLALPMLLVGLRLVKRWTDTNAPGTTSAATASAEPSVFPSHS